MSYRLLAVCLALLLAAPLCLSLDDDLFGSPAGRAVSSADRDDPDGRPPLAFPDLALEAVKERAEGLQVAAGQDADPAPAN